MKKALVISKMSSVAKQAIRKKTEISEGYTSYAGQILEALDRIVYI